MSQYQPLISVIVPNYNHEAFLEERLESVFQQSYIHIEVILLDDKSSDNSVEIIKRYAQHPQVSHVVLNSNNSGSPFAQWDKGIKLAKGEYIWIAESDDVAEKDFLSELIAFLARQPHKLDIIYAQSLDINELGQALSNRLEYTADIVPNIWVSSFQMPGNEFITQYQKIKNVIPNASAAIFKREKAQSIDFSTPYLTMRTSGDRLFWIEMLRNGQMGFVAKTLNYFRTHSTVTRQHNTFEKVHRRCMEERLIRIYLAEHFACEQQHETIVLYRRWFIVNPVSALFKPLFYSVRMPYTSYIAYIWQYLWFRIDNCGLLQRIRYRLSKWRKNTVNP